MSWAHFHSRKRNPQTPPRPTPPERDSSRDSNPAKPRVGTIHFARCLHGHPAHKAVPSSTPKKKQRGQNPPRPAPAPQQCSRCGATSPRHKASSHHRSNKRRAGIRYGGPLALAPLPTRAPLLRLLLRRGGHAHSAVPAARAVCSAPPRPRRGALFLGPGASGGRQRSGVGSRTMSASIYSTTLDAESAMTKNGGDVEPLPFVYDKHGGIIIEMTSPMDPQAFSASLKSLLFKWREQGIRGVWIKLPISLANLIQSAVEEGFWYHHAEETYLMLAYWLPNTPHTLPVNATHRVGVGAFVMNDKREVLVVQEKSGVLKGLGIWKFPTGVVEPGEDINIGVVREVKEETGVDAEFVEVLAFRQSHKAYFEKSDLFFVCILRPLSVDITKQESEIEDAQWMPVEEFAAQPFVQKHEMVKYILEVGLAKADKEYAGFSPISIKSAFSEKQSLFYMNRRDLEKASGSVSTQKDS